MASGTFVTFNKKQPGVYFNRKVMKRVNTNQAIEGVVLYPFDLDWGTRDKIIEISSLQDCFNKLGYYYTDEKMRPIVEMFRGSNRTQGASKVEVIIPSVSGQAKASATIGTGKDKLTATAKCYGTRGNDITFAIIPDLDTEITTDVYAVYKVQTLVGNIVVSSKTYGSFTSSTVYTQAKIGDLQSNDFLEWGGDKNGLLTATAGTTLTGGVSASPSDAEMSTVLDAVDDHFFNVLCYDGTSSTVKSAFNNFVMRQWENKGYYCQLVTSQFDGDFEGLTSIQNGMILSDGFTLTPEKATWWYSGCTAGAKSSESLTHIQHPLAVDVTKTYTSDELDQFIDNGQIVFIKEFDVVMVMKDINTLHTFTDEKGQDLSSNKLVRALNEICNYCNYQYNIYYVGDVPNDESGYDLLQGNILGKLRNMAANRAIKNVETDDVVINPVEGDSEAIEMLIGIQGVGSIEKIYIRLTSY